MQQNLLNFDAEQLAAWFAAQDGAKAAMKGRTAQDAFAKWTDMIRLMV